MNLRIIYCKSSDDLKNTIDKWISKIEPEEYYNNIYLEDVILSIK